MTHYLDDMERAHKRLSETEIRYGMAIDALEYIAARKPRSDDPRELHAFIADLQETAKVEVQRKI